MEPIVLLGAAVVLLATIGVGIVAHELSHAAVLHAIGIPYEIRWFPGRNADGHFGIGVFQSWATVTPRRIPRESPVWGLRLSAIAPLVLASPFALVLVGVVPDPLEVSNVFVAAITVAWFGCALPSPQDFSVFWHAERALADHADTAR